MVLSDTGHIFLRTHTKTAARVMRILKKLTNGGETAYLHTFKDLGQFYTSTKEKEVDGFITVTKCFCRQRNLDLVDGCFSLTERKPVYQGPRPVPHRAAERLQSVHRPLRFL